MNAQFPDAYITQIVIEDEPELAASFGISESPTLIIMREQVILYLEPALPEPEIFEGLLRRAGGLDMARVRAEDPTREKSGSRDVLSPGLSDRKAVGLGAAMHR